MPTPLPVDSRGVRTVVKHIGTRERKENLVEKYVERMQRNILQKLIFWFYKI
jgi:hypothetical protein